MKQPVEAVKWTCDGCGKTEAVAYLEHEDEPPRGWIVGTAAQDGNGGKWEACRSGCVKKAVMETITWHSSQDFKETE